MAMLTNIFNRSTERELGFGSSAQTQGRLMNSDGSINSIRQGGRLGDNFFQDLVRMSWMRFVLLVFGFFAAINLLFALIYYEMGIEKLMGVEAGSPLHNFMETFFFSSQTLTTVGYGRISPVGFVMSMMASFEALIGLLSFALISGLLYGRFSRPTARVLFSENAVIAPYRDGRGLMFRMANGRKSELLETEVTLILAVNQTTENGAQRVVRKFHNLELELAKATFFTLSWTIVHPMTEKSPLFGWVEGDLEHTNAELLVLVKGVDDSYAQVVHARKSYLWTEMVWGAKFIPIIDSNKKGRSEVHLSRLNEHQMVELA